MSFSRNPYLKKLLQKAGNVNWPLLLTLIALTQNRFFALKPLAILGAALLLGVRRQGKEEGPRLHLFYFAMGILCLFQTVFVVRDFSLSYLTVAAYAVGLWALMGIAFLFLKSATFRFSPASGVATLEAYFGVAVLLTGVNLIGVIAAAGTFNPYEGATEPLFGVSSGDHLSGLYGFNLWMPQLGDFSSINAAVMALFTLWFFTNRQWGKMLLAGITLLLTVSNLVNLLLFAVLGLYALWKRQRVYFGVLAIALMLTIGFYGVVTPGNFSYGVSQLKSKSLPSSTGGNAERDIASQNARLQRQSQTVLSFNPDHRSGKAEAFLQTKRFLFSGPGPALWGAGPGRFSSTLAQLAATPPGEAKGRFFAPLQYISPLYAANHGAIQATIKALPPKYHSVSQLPASWYNQLLGEYGIMGLLLFSVLYVIACFKTSVPGRALLLLALLLLLADYTFEALCFIPIFEWMILLSQRKHSQNLPFQHE